MNPPTSRELLLGKLLDEVISLWTLCESARLDQVSQGVTLKAMREIARLRKDATAFGVEYPITLGLHDHLVKKGMLRPSPKRIVKTR